MFPCTSYAALRTLALVALATFVLNADVPADERQPRDRTDSSRTERSAEPGERQKAALENLSDRAEQWREDREARSETREERAEQRREARQQRRAERDVRDRIEWISNILINHLSRIEFALDDEGSDKIVIHLGPPRTAEEIELDQASGAFRAGDRLTLYGREGRFSSRLMTVADRMASADSSGRLHELSGHVIDMEYGPAAGSRLASRSTPRRFDDTSHLHVCVIDQDGKSTWIDVGRASDLSSDLTFNIGEQVTVSGAMRGRGDRSRMVAQEIRKDGNAFSVNDSGRATVAGRPDAEATGTTTR